MVKLYYSQCGGFCLQPESMPSEHVWISECHQSRSVNVISLDQWMSSAWISNVISMDQWMSSAWISECHQPGSANVISLDQRMSSAWISECHQSGSVNIKSQDQLKSSAWKCISLDQVFCHASLPLVRPVYNWITGRRTDKGLLAMKQQKVIGASR